MNLDTSATLSVKIDGIWSAELFALFFDRINKLYHFYQDIQAFQLLLAEDLNDKSYSDKRYKPSTQMQLKSSIFNDSLGFSYFPCNRRVGGNQVIVRSKRTKNILSPIEGYDPYESNLLVKKIKFSSPGSVDFLGIAGVLGHLKELFMAYVPGKKTKKEIQILDEQRVKLRIENTFTGRSISIGNQRYY